MDSVKRSLLICLYCLTLFASLDAFQRPGPTVIPSQPDNTYFLSILNGYRQLAREGQILDQPKAIALPDLTWDGDLTNKARARAENCLYQYERPQTVGEVFAYSLKADEEPLHETFDGHREFEFGKVVYGLGHHLHYTQIVWQNTTSVGCWRHLCGSLKTAWKTLDNAYFTVCKFSPRGNVLGEAPYIYRKPTKWEIREPDAPFERPGVPNRPHLATFTVLTELHNGYRKLIREDNGISYVNQGVDLGKYFGNPVVPSHQDPPLNLSEYNACLPTANRNHMSNIRVRTQECSMLNLNRNTDYTEIAGYTLDPYNNPFHDYFDEYKNFTYGQLGQGWEKTQRYTQMVWAKTVHLTCHTRICYPFRTLEGEYIDAAFSVCWYSPKGNILGEYPYPKFDEHSTTTYKPGFWD